VQTTDPKTSITGFGLWVYDTRGASPQTGGNVYHNGARPSAKEVTPLILAEVDPAVKLAEKSDGWYLEMKCDKAWSAGPNRKLVTTEWLGKAAIPNLPYENPDGTPLRIDGDYFGKPRNPAGLAAGPFANPGTGTLSLKVR
jgi:alpha-N-arabinofuranosidase